MSQEGIMNKGGVDTFLRKFKEDLYDFQMETPEEVDYFRETLNAYMAEFLSNWPELNQKDTEKLIVNGSLYEIPGELYKKVTDAQIRGDYEEQGILIENIENGFEPLTEPLICLFD